MKLSKRTVSALILIGILVLMLVIWLVIPKNSGNTGIPSGGDSAANSVIMLAEDDYKLVTDLSYTYNGEKMTFKYSENTGKWSYIGEDGVVYKSLPIDQTTVTTMAAAIAQVGANRLVADMAFADCGLDDPFMSISISYSNGVSRTFNIGDYISFNDSYYFNVGGNDSVYTIASGLIPYFQYTILGLVVADTLPDLNSSTVTLAGYMSGDKSVEDTEAMTGIIKSVKLGSPKGFTDYEYYGVDDETGTELTVNYTSAENVSNEDGSIASTVHVSNEFDMVVGNGYIRVVSSGLVYEVGENITREIRNLIK